MQKKLFMHFGSIETSNGVQKLPHISNYQSEHLSDSIEHCHLFKLHIAATVYICMFKHCILKRQPSKVNQFTELFMSDWIAKPDINITNMKKSIKIQMNLLSQKMHVN